MATSLVRSYLAQNRFRTLRYAKSANRSIDVGTENKRSDSVGTEMAENNINGYWGGFQSIDRTRSNFCLI